MRESESCGLALVVVRLPARARAPPPRVSLRVCAPCPTMTSHPPRTRPIGRLPWHAAATAVLGALWLFAALAVCERTVSATYAARQAVCARGSVEGQRSKLSCVEAVLLSITRWQDKLSWTFTRPPMAPTGETAPTGSMAIPAARSGLVFTARTTLSLDCTLLVGWLRGPIYHAINQSINHQSTLSRYLMIIIITSNRDLSFNRLSGTIPSSIGSLVNLEYLYAQSNT